MAYPCQICLVIPSPTRDHMSTLLYIGKVNDLCRPTDEAFITRQRSNQIQCCNYAEDLNGLFRPDDDRAALFSSSFMSCYGSLNLPKRPSGESFSRIRWALKNNKNEPLSADRPGLKVESGKAPCPLLFPICPLCARLTRNYLHHRFKNRPPYGDDDLYGFDLLYDALLKRFVQANSGVDHPVSLYHAEDNDEVEMIGRAIVVRLVAEKPGSQNVKISGGADAFMQIPSMPKWIMSKLQPISKEETAKVVQNQTSRTTSSANSSILSRLPQELLEQITWDLDRPSVLALRLAHPYLAGRLPLDQAFWCNELLYGEPPLFGFEPLIDNHASRHPGEFLGRIDPLSELGAHYTKPRTRSKFAEAQEPAKRLRNGSKVAKRDWREYDWKALVKLLSTSAKFEEGEVCADAPPGFLLRRRIWGAIDRLVDGRGSPRTS